LVAVVVELVMESKMVTMVVLVAVLVETIQPKVLLELERLDKETLAVKMSQLTLTIGEQEAVVVKALRAEM
jgi:hypothetical protein